MDHMDWFDPVPESRPAPTIEAARKDSDKSISDLDREIIELSRVIRKGGCVFWRSAAKKPWYNQRFEVSVCSRRARSNSDLWLFTPVLIFLIILTFICHQKMGFQVEPIHIRETGKAIDNVNM